MVYRVKITIRGIRPPVWRRLRIPGTLTFAQLHRVIQVAFGWLDYHLYDFRFGNIVIAKPAPDFSAEELFGEGVQAFDPQETTIDQLFDKHDRCVYRYDYGDCWVHDIVVEKRLNDTKESQVPLCLGGARHRPPEDVGGVGGYYEFLETIRDEKNPEREDMLCWAQKDTRGRRFDPEYFYVDEVNRRLAHVLEDDRAFAVSLLASKRGLTGALRFGWWEPYVEVDGKHYSWERIGELLARLDEGLTVTIKVSKTRRPGVGRQASGVRARIRAR
ncbi:MAG TPA: plasmid pRiA4b ORF-3 family protein [Firmicutes bacterium]|nr:plasmid pRiA4b ORF-3 family protein [Bacillota bacterium]